ncbi:MAG: D-2-hydroxyacid dehydrogenase [Actinobacteria bacterium]|nr:D-2-hydroxyacid dehydrogenase [Actinomycetota bacterium]
MSQRSRPVVVVLGGADLPSSIQRITEYAFLSIATGDRLADELPEADVLLIWRSNPRALAAAWPKADRLRWIHTASAGTGGLPSAEMIGRDVLLTSSRGLFDEPIAEYVLGLVLAFAKDLASRVRLQANREWRHRETERVSGRTALVAGTGTIGRAIARKLRAAGMAVTGVGRVGRSEDADFGDVLPMDRWLDGLRFADYVVLAAPLTPDTRGMVDGRALAAMKPTARLINVGRAGLIVLDDLIRALRGGTISGAALDVFADEQLDEGSPLWGMPQVLLSPHMSGQVAGWREELVALFVDNLTRYVEGRELRNVVDRKPTNG